MSWKPKDVIAVLFSAGIVLILMMAAYSISILGTEITEERKTLIGVVVTGVMSVIIMYMQGEKDDEDK